MLTRHLIAARAIGIDMALFVVNLWSDARFGRQEEGFSEEPTLTAALAAACTEGAHGMLQLPPDAYLPATAAAALFKHVGAYAAAAGGLNSGRADSPEVTVRDVYLKPWRRAAWAGARGVMPSHNTVLGVPAHGSAWLLSTVSVPHSIGLRCKARYWLLARTFTHCRSSGASLT